METKKEIKPQFRVTKLWVKAQGRPNHIVQKQTNRTIESSFIRLLAKAKELSKGDRQPIFERDYRHDKTDSETIMHAYMSSTIYLLLECDYQFNFAIQYSFNNCPFEKELTALMIGYPYDLHSTNVDLKPDFNTFYRNVLNYQDKKYITSRTR